MYKKSIILLSGGLDSSVTAFYAKQNSKQLYGLTSLYGQKHKKEITSAKNIGQTLHMTNHAFFSLDLSQFGGSSLFKRSVEKISENISLEDIGKTIPSTYVPARNTIFLSIALAYAETIKAEAIYIGVTSSDYSGYPDCRPVFISAYQELINKATKTTINGNKIFLETPLINLSKQEIVKKGIQLNVPFEKTWSCYKGEKKACGTCDSCQLRLKGFLKAGFADPLEYETTPKWYTIKD